MKKLASATLLAILPALAQQPKFEIADVHISKTAYWFAQQNAGAAVIRDGLYIYRDATLLHLIQAAYGVTEDTVGGGPGWLKSDLFDVVAKLPEGATPANIKLMLQAMLAERFSLVIHNEMHPMPRFVLTVVKGGAKLKRAAPSDDSGCRGQPGSPGGRGGDGPSSIPNLKVTCHNLTSAQIADNLHAMAGGYTTYLTHDVMDATNLEGKWDFDLEFTPATLLPDKGSDGISIFDAVNKQLGLKLELQDVPVPTLVVASVNRKPTPNSPEVATALAMAAPRFEVAAIKPANPDQRPPAPQGLGYAGGSQMRIGGTLRSLIALAFQIQPNAANDEILGLPKAAEPQIWDITAKMPSAGEGAPDSTGGRSLPPPLSVSLEMLRGLLIDRFELKTHTENREVTVYAVTLGSGKLKLTKADESERTVCIPDPNAPKPFPNLWVMANCKNFTMDEFARNLEQVTGRFDHPIVDGTGLQGGWNYLIGFDHHPPPQAPNPNQPAGTVAAASDPGYMSAYEALEKELGLKLVKTKRSIPVIIVDHVDEKPLE